MDAASLRIRTRGWGGWVGTSGRVLDEGQGRKGGAEAGGGAGGGGGGGSLSALIFFCLGTTLQFWSWLQPNRRQFEANRRRLKANRH